LSLLVKFLYEVRPRDDGFRMGINYGVNRVRFPAPVPVGSRIRGRFKILEVTDVEGGIQVVTEGTVEREGQEKPVCVAEMVSRHYR
jgi:acyl dehydratase